MCRLDFDFLIAEEKLGLKDRVSLIKRRYDIPFALVDNDFVTLELGVAEGGFTEAILRTGRVKHHYAIDRYSGERTHDEHQYFRALKRIDPYRQMCSLIRADFSMATEFFPDHFFDFIYIDGYAHSGQEEGRTLYDWWPKLRINGLFLGDDYSEQFPNTVKAVDEFVSSKGLSLHVTNCMPGDDWASQHQSWVTQKT